MEKWAFDEAVPFRVYDILDHQGFSCLIDQLRTVLSRSTKLNRLGWSLRTLVVPTSGGSDKHFRRMNARAYSKSIWSPICIFDKEL
jgi:hypothetical protein